MNSKNNITIFTPTYNREKFLKKIYESLKSQSYKNFVWLIIDDGSSDNTREVVKKMITEKKVKIEYYYKSNGGKHTAFNQAFDLCKTQYLVCIDSDDFLLDGDLKKINTYINLYSEENVLGLVFPRKNNANVLEKFEKLDKMLIDVMDLKFKTNINVETTIVMNMNKISNYRFPIYSNEKFVSEEILYNKLSKIGKFIYINEFVTNSDYLTDGLTNNIFNHYKKSPRATLEMFNSRYHFLKKYKFSIKFINRIKTIVNLNALCMSINMNFWFVTPSKILSVILMPVSLVWKRSKYE